MKQNEQNKDFFINRSGFKFQLGHLQTKRRGKKLSRLTVARKLLFPHFENGKN